jgi:prolyl-tRNA editing enzyme YbaK/EbsC (Cys-tRNA(Pro) deacylase)
LVEIWGYEPGSVPPFGHRTRIPTYIDSTCAHNAIFPITLAQLVAVTGGEITFIVKPPPNELNRIIPEPPLPDQP